MIPRKYQVILNLLTNAVKYTPQGSVKLALSLPGGEGSGLSTGRDGERSTTVRFVVSDTGVGIPDHRVEATENSRVRNQRNRRHVSARIAARW